MSLQISCGLLAAPTIMLSWIAQTLSGLNGQASGTPLHLLKRTQEERHHKGHPMSMHSTSSGLANPIPSPGPGPSLCFLQIKGHRSKLPMSGITVVWNCCLEPQERASPVLTLLRPSKEVLFLTLRTHTLGNRQICVQGRKFTMEMTNAFSKPP